MKLFNVIKKSLLTAIIGLFAGFIFGLVIWAMALVVSSSVLEMPPREVIVFLGMGCGAVLGAIFGGIVGLKER